MTWKNPLLSLRLGLMMTRKLQAVVENAGTSGRFSLLALKLIGKNESRVSSLLTSSYFCITYPEHGGMSACSTRSIASLSIALCHLLLLPSCGALPWSVAISLYCNCRLVLLVAGSRRCGWDLARCVLLSGYLTCLASGGQSIDCALDSTS